MITPSMPSIPSAPAIPPTPSIRIAACITTMNRPEALSACLDALACCDPAPMSIVVSDDSSEPAWIAKNREIVARHPNVTYVTGPRRGVCSNRNHAFSQVSSAANYVSFIDDDLLLPSHFFGTATDFYQALPEQTRTRTICTGSRDDMADGPVSLTFRGYFMQTDSPGSATVASAVFPVALFDVERWDENIFFGSEDAELCLRATAANFAIVFLPELTSRHLATDAGVLTKQQATGGLTRYEMCCEAARLYIGAKRYRIIEPNPLKLAAFLFVYFAHMTLYLARKRALGSFGQLVRLSNVRRVWLGTP